MTIKSYTDLEQSRKLAEILPLETADQIWQRIAIAGANLNVPEELQYRHDGDIPFQYYSGIGTPCWSLAALSEFILPYIADNDGNNYKFYLSKDGLDRWVAYYKSDNVSIHICEESDNMIDVILEMVCWLKNEEYI
jgi:hypothetical protein